MLSARDFEQLQAAAMLLERPRDFFAIPLGTLRLTRIDAGDDPSRHCYLFVGDATAAPMTALWPDPGATLPAPRPESELPFRLKIIHFNDLHGHLVHFSRHGTRPVFAQIAGHLNALRSRYYGHPQRGVLAFSGGDDSVGSVFDALLGSDTASYRAHAAYRLYSAAGIDACVMGNHDLDLGVRRLAHALRTDARFPLLTANLAGCSWLSGLYFPAALLVVKGVRVAVVGLTTPAQIAPQPDSTLNFVDPVGVMRNLLPMLHEVSDVVIVLSHLGYSLESSSASVLGVGDVELAQALPPASVHAIIGGHTHHALNEHGLSPLNIVNGIPIAQAGKLGEFVGEVDITVGRHGATVTSVHLTPTVHLPVDEAFETRHVQPLLDAVVPIFHEPLGWAVENDDLSVDAVRNDFAAGESALCNFIADALVERTRLAGYPVDFAAIDASCIAAGVPAGSITYGDWFAVMPFADTIRLCRISGAELQQLLADNARRADRPDEAHTERGFLHFSRALRYRIRLGTARAEATAAGVTVNGKPLDHVLDREFVVACTSFMHMLANTWQQQSSRQWQMQWFDPHALQQEDIHRFLRDELVAYIRAHGGVTADGGCRRDGRLVVEDEGNERDETNATDFSQ